MRGSHRILSVLALGSLLLLAPSCSTDSPTAPAQSPPPPGGGTTPTQWRITITADPPELFKIEPDELNALNCGPGSGDDADEAGVANIKIKVDSPVDGSIPQNGTTILVTTNLGSFIGADQPVQQQALELQGGVAFTQLFPCQTPGNAQVLAQLGSSVGQVTIKISIDSFEARWRFENPEANPSVQFVNLSLGDASLLWNFGDGTTSTEEHPHHVFPGVGTWQVRLTITKGQRTDTCEITLSTTQTGGECPAENSPPVPLD